MARVIFWLTVYCKSYLAINSLLQWRRFFLEMNQSTPSHTYGTQGHACAVSIYFQKFSIYLKLFENPAFHPDLLTSMAATGNSCFWKMNLLIGLKNADFLEWIFVPLKEKLKKSKLQSKCHKIRTDWQCHGKHWTPTALRDMPVQSPSTSKNSPST
jgi:hypothetical protein